MPSLQALEEFRSSFNHLGNELQTLTELEIPHDDLPLPDHEPLPAALSESAAPSGGDSLGPDFANTEETALNESGPDDAEKDGAVSGDTETNAFNFGDLGDLLGGLDNADFSADENADDDVTGDDAAAFGSFIDSIPDDFGVPKDAGESETGPSPDDFPPGPESPVPEDFEEDPTAALLDGLADEIESARETAETGEEAASDGVPAGPKDSSGQKDRIDQVALQDMDSLETVELHREETAVESLASSETGETGPEDFPDGETAADNGDSFGDGLDLSELGLEDLPDDAGAADNLDLSVPEGIPNGEAAADSEDSFGDGFDLSELGLEDLPVFDSEETGSLDDPDLFSAPAADTALNETGEITLPEEILPAENFDTTESPDEEDNFDLGGETSNFDTEAVLEELPGDAFDRFDLDSGSPGADGGEDSGKLDDFSLPELDSVFDGSLPVKTASPGTGGVAGSGWEGVDGTVEVEEVRLTERELEQLQETLSSYPLNLRIACEELIAEEVVAPDQLSRLLNLLVKGASAGETAALAGRILGRTIPIPKGYEKKTGEALEIEQSSFAYIFVHNFLPVLRLFMAAALVLLSAGYLCWKFIYLPVKAEDIYELGIERIEAGDYSRANERFTEAFKIHEKKPWFYTYARAFRDARQYTLAEEKYQELLYYTASKNKRHIPDKEAVLEYADLESNYIGDFETADRILRNNLLDYYPFDGDALLALGDNSLAWGEYEPSRLENAREYFALYMEHNGRTDPLLERMLKYFIRSDNLGETLPLQSYFMASPKRSISAATLAELGGYLLDKRYETVKGVPNEYLDSISGIREVLLRAIRQDPTLPESYYHLARYYNYYENPADEASTLELAAQVFDAAKQESSKRLRYHILTLQRYGEVLTGRKEFFPAEEQLVRGVNLYEDGLSRRLLEPAPEYGRLYAGLGDLEYFVKDGDMESALDYYHRGEENGFAPTELQYRMGAAHYQLRQWGPALERIYSAYRETAPNRRILYALGNASYMRGNYFAAQGYYDKLLGMLEADRDRLPLISAGDDEKQLDLAERLMVVQNNLGVTLDALTERSGNNSYRSRAQGLYADSERAWDVLTRNPQSMLRMRPSPEISAPGVNPAYLNVQNSLHPTPGYESQFFLRIDKDMLEPSPWEDLAPPGYRLSEGIYTGR